MLKKIQIWICFNYQASEDRELDITREVEALEDKNQRLRLVHSGYIYILKYFTMFFTIECKILLWICNIFYICIY